MQVEGLSAYFEPAEKAEEGVGPKLKGQSAIALLVVPDPAAPSHLLNQKRLLLRLLCNYFVFHFNLYLVFVILNQSAC